MGDAYMYTVHAVRLTAALVLALGLTGCGSSEQSVMPDVVGTQLDTAKSDIERSGFGGDVEVLGGGIFGIVNDPNWQVCEQLPPAGESVTDAPRLTVDRSCETAAEPTEAPTEGDAPSAEPAPADPMVTDITVDELLNKLNSGEMGGIKVGDQFRLTGELFMSDLWMSSPATGEYFVLLKAQDGAQDLMVFVEESDAAGWQDGTQVEMVVANVEVTINGETTDGWLRAQSVKTIS